MQESDDLMPLLWPGMTAAERARAYSPSSMLDGPIDPWIAAYADKSAAARAGLCGWQSLSYGPHPRQAIDLIRPDLPGPVPLHIFIHGGYWQELSKAESLFPAPALLTGGTAFAALDYRLAPEARLEEIVQDCLDGLRELTARAGDLGIDPAAITLSGSSAGAHLAALCCLRLPVEQRPRAVALVSGIYDLEPLVGTYINDPLQLTPATARALSPGCLPTTALSGFPPALLAWGAAETDEFKRQSLRFAGQLSRAGAQVATAEIPGRNHFDVIEGIAAPGPLATAFDHLKTQAGLPQNA
ncbi:alpha/beta hydrolase [Pseudodonghicola flavimaris]|uniref:Alpha/beta hydrolase n=1 Tax=Pseudodonghicola flavimaris TaxID=3050036 RepID=A0ABT7EZ37_9RHOB|nr:alpha/beta hydrolase [Pseudodonghicola flavimaris]MDK3017598.1 alpha/beta hydrolase [Pseudodonghicola flavimaris]